jgi:hypothetical protein
MSKQFERTVRGEWKKPGVTTRVTRRLVSLSIRAAA